MRNYELAIIMDPDIAEDDVPQTMDKLNAIVSKNGGEVTETNHWGRRRLSYPIGRHAEGNYVLLRFSMEPEKAKDLEANLNLAEEYLRHLLIKLED